MKIAMKIMIISVAGLITAIIVYPFMHESGHALATLIFGGKVIEYTLLPLPNILADISGVSQSGLTAIGMSGVIFPFFLSAVIYPKKFIFWYSAFVFKGIVLLSTVISAVVIILNHFGWTDVNDDMVKVLQYGNLNEYYLLIILAVVTIMTVIQIIATHPLSRIRNELKIRTEDEA